MEPPDELLPELLELELLELELLELELELELLPPDERLIEVEVDPDPLTFILTQTPLTFFQPKLHLPPVLTLVPSGLVTHLPPICLQPFDPLGMTLVTILFLHFPPVLMILPLLMTCLPPVFLQTGFFMTGTIFFLHCPPVLMTLPLLIIGLPPVFFQIAFL